MLESALCRPPHKSAPKFLRRPLTFAAIERSHSNSKLARQRILLEINSFEFPRINIDTRYSSDNQREGNNKEYFSELESRWN